MLSKKISRCLIVSLMAIGSAIAAIAPVQVGDLAITDFWAKPNVAGKNSAAYLTISNPKEVQDKLVKVESDVAATMELHNHMNENGVMKMRPVNAIDIIGKEVSLKPGSLHIMFMGLKQDLKEGEVVTLKLTFEKAGIIQIEFPIKKPVA